MKPDATRTKYVKGGWIEINNKFKDIINIRVSNREIEIEKVDRIKQKEIRGRKADGQESGNEDYITLDLDQDNLEWMKE